MGRPTAALDALRQLPPVELVATTVQYGHLLAPAPQAAMPAAASDAACGLGQLLRVCAPSLLLSVLAQVGGHLALADGLRLIREPIEDRRLSAELQARPLAADTAASALSDSDLLARYLERYDLFFSPLPRLDIAASADTRRRGAAVPGCPASC